MFNEWLDEWWVGGGELSGTLILCKEILVLCVEVTVIATKPSWNF